MMEMTRRGFLKGMAGILAAGVAPAAIGSGVLMPIKKLWVPEHVTNIQLSGIDVVSQPLWDGMFRITNDGPTPLTVLGFSGFTRGENVIVLPGESKLFRCQAGDFAYGDGE